MIALEMIELNPSCCYCSCFLPMVDMVERFKYDWGWDGLFLLQSVVNLWWRQCSTVLFRWLI